MCSKAGALSLDGLDRGAAEGCVADAVAVALAGFVAVPFTGVVAVSLAGVIAVAVAGAVVGALAGVVACALAAGVVDLAGASLLGMGVAELRRVSDLRVGSFQDFSFVSLLYQYFLPLTSYCFHGWLAGVGSAFAAGALLGVAASGAAVPANFGAEPFAAVATCAVGSFHDFSLVSLLYQYFFPTRTVRPLTLENQKGPSLTSRFNCIDLPW